MNKLEKTVLKKMLENHLTVDHKLMTIEKLAKITDKTEDELYKIIGLLLIKKYVRMNHVEYYWTVNPFTITEKGLNALEFPWTKVVQNFFIGLATFVAVIALFFKFQ